MTRPRSRRRHGSIDPKQVHEELDAEPTVPTAPPAAAEPGWTKHQLMEASEFSGKTFDTIRKAARVKGPTHGGLRHLFDAEDLIRLIDKAEGGKFSRIGTPAARAWRAMLAEAGVAMPEVISRTRR